MEKMIFLIMIFGAFACATSISPISPVAPPTESNTDSVEVVAAPFATNLSQLLVNTISQRIGSIAQLLNLKIRLARFLVSLYTTENLILFRNLIEYAMKLGNVLLRFLPNTTEEPRSWWIPVVSQFLNTTAGQGGLLNLAFGPPAVETPDEVTEALLGLTEVSTNPPVYFNAPVATNDASESNKTNHDDLVRQSRSSTKEMHYINEEEPRPLNDNDEPSHDARLRMFEERIMTLHRLINAKRK